MTIALCSTLLHLPRAANASHFFFLLVFILFLFHRPVLFLLIPSPVTVFPSFLFPSSTSHHIPSGPHPQSAPIRVPCSPTIPYSTVRGGCCYRRCRQLTPPGPSGKPPVASRRFEPTSTTLYSHSHVSHPPPGSRPAQGTCKRPSIASHRVDTPHRCALRAIATRRGSSAAASRQPANPAQRGPDKAKAKAKPQAWLPRVTKTAHLHLQLHLPANQSALPSTITPVTTATPTQSPLRDMRLAPSTRSSTTLAACTDECRLPARACTSTTTARPRPESI